MPSWKGKTRGGLLGYKIFVFLLKKSGIKAAYGLLRIVAAYFIVFAPTATTSIYRYFREIHQFGRIRACRAIYQNFYLLGQTLIDKVAIMANTGNKFSYTFKGENHLIGLNDLNKGGILISAHLGNWEIAGFLLKRINMRINIVMFEEEHEKIKNYLGKVMHPNKINIIPIKQDLSHIFQINNALRKKEVICMHGDRFVEGSRVDAVDFMGKKAYFPLGPFTIAAKLKVPYTFVYSVKGKNNQYNLSATPPVVGHNKKPQEILQEYVHSLEEKVKEYPLQWFNYYDFWSKNLKGGVYEQGNNE